ncbi:MAG: MFS transporter [Deltaproteobacteria bacterium]|nr:MFS transporter [Deltaproteobacteria bacterium]
MTNESFGWIVLGLLCISGFMVGVSVYCLPSLYAEITQQIPLTKTQMAMLMSGFKIAMLFGFVGGSISDKIGPRWAYGLAVLIVSIAGAFRGFSDSATTLIACMFFIGIGMSVVFPNIAKSLRMYFPSEKMALTMGICVTAMGVGAAIGVGTAADILSPSFNGWRNTLLIIGLVTSVPALIWIIFSRDKIEPTTSGVKERNPAENLREVFKSKNIRTLSLYNIFQMVNFIGVLAFLPISLTERGISRAGELVSIFVIMSSVAAIPIGIISDRVGKRKPFIITASIVFALSTIAFSFAEGAFLIIALLLGGSAVGVIFPLLSVVTVELKEIGPALAATAVGTLLAFGSIGGGIGPPICGKIMDLTGTQWPGFLLMGSASLLAAIVLLRIPETGQKKAATKLSSDEFEA